MSLLHIIILAIVQGLAELLPVSSSAHVIVVERLLQLDPEKPEMTLFLVMLHTGTMFAVIVYFWQAWKRSLFASWDVFKQQAARLAVATMLTAAVGYPLKWGIEKWMEKSGCLANDATGHPPKAEIEMLFSNLGLVAGALFAVGVLILIAGLLERRAAHNREIGFRDAALIGAVQGLCVPFRGFSRSGATISTGMLLGNLKPRLEEFSFALAVIITPAVVHHEASRLIAARHEAGQSVVTWSALGPSLLGMFFAFLAGLLALKWLSGWLEGGRWYLFGIYCLVAAGVVFGLHCKGY